MRNKGFTLVELVVVMVIIVLLAAVGAPGILGYIDDMQNKSYINDARMAVTSAQSELMDVYQSGKASLTKEKKSSWVSRMEYAGTGILFYVDIVDNNPPQGYEKRAYTIKKALYEDNGVRVYYENGIYSVLDSNVTITPPAIEMTDTGADSKLLNR